MTPWSAAAGLHVIMMGKFLSKRTDVNSSAKAWTIAASVDNVFAIFDTARGSTPVQLAEDEYTKDEHTNDDHTYTVRRFMDAMSRFSQYADP
ncbi:hypothetical protein KXD40_009279 [Peronospora effusa]|uniref:Uncharacterized protein n=1 Tax=Peronospora effusa TaxID=542832 RepID=A0A3R7VYF5_9STRA|nr:hypothetical protein DD237_008584 [Peronospora effusa]UIZ28694.1 hypothetical protein KXD40_009279 [Peronospora effusa]